MKPYTFILAALGAYRITRLLTTDTLPIVAKPRAGLLRRFGSSSWSELLTCTYCLGAWVSLAALVVAKWAGYMRTSWPHLFLLWPALSGAQALLSALDNRLN